MDEDEDSGGKVGNEELLAWLHQKLGNMPEPTTPRDASRRLLVDLEVVQQAFNRHYQIGCEAGMLAIVRACHAFDRTDLATPFRVLAKGPRDLREGRPPRGWRKPSYPVAEPEKSGWQPKAGVGVGHPR